MKTCFRLILAAIFLTAVIPVLAQTANVPIEGTFFLKEQHDGLYLSVEATFIIPEGYYQSNQPDFFGIDISSPSFRLIDTDYPDNSEHRGHTKITARFLVDSLVEIPETADILFRYQLCDEAGTCFFPVSCTYSIVPDFSETHLSEQSFSLACGEPDTQQYTSGNQFSRNATETPDLTAINTLDTGTRLSGLLYIILLAFAGGLILNVMPCVLPVLSIKAMHLVSMRDKDTRLARRQGLAYASGILFSMLALGIITALLKLAGEISGWGFQFQNPYFTTALVTALFIFSLSLFDLFIITLPGLNFPSTGKHERGMSGFFAGGAFAVLLATPCTAPFMGTALGFAFTLGPLLIIITFAAIGLGFGFPFLVLSCFPGLTRWIPRPGPWMNTFRIVLGFILIATVGWLVNSIYYLTGWTGVIRLFTSFFVICMLLWIFGTLQKSMKNRLLRRVILLLVTVLVVSGILWTGSASGSSEAPGKAGWQSFDPVILERERNNLKPVFVAFSAEWCLSCKKNEVAVLNTKEIRSLFENQNVTLLLGDYTRGDPLIGEWISLFGRSGVPLYAFYRPGADKAEILPQVLSKTDIYSLFY